MAQIRRSKLRCTCHGAIFERVLVRRTQEYKSIPRTTSRKSPEIAHVRRHGSLPCMPLFSPRKPRFRRRCAPLKVSLWRRMSADATGIFILTGDNALPLTAFALAFSPVSPLSVAAFAALKVSFPGACPGKDGFFILTKRQHPRCAYACSNVFSSCYSFGEDMGQN